MLEDFFCEGLFTIQCIKENIIKPTTLVDIYATGFGFIDEKFAGNVCKRFEIPSQ